MAALTAVGALVVILVVALAAYSIKAMLNDADDTFTITVETSDVAPGVQPGTKVILRGAEVGEINSLQRASSESVEMDVTLDPNRISGVTDEFAIDFRPENYFGVTALNLVSRPGGTKLKSGSHFVRDTVSDFTMSTMIEKGSILTSDVLSDDMVKTLDKVLDYTNGLTPLLRAGLVFADVVAKTQKALPAKLIADTNNILAELPSFLRETIEGGYTIFQGDYNRLPDGSIGINDKVLNMSSEGLELASGALFSAVGNLLKSHDTELTPAVEIVRLYADVVPGIVGGTTGARLRGTIDRFTEVLGGSGNKPSLRLRLIMDDLPAISAPLALGGLKQGEGP